MKGKSLKQLQDLAKRKKQKIRKLEAEIRSEKGTVAQIERTIPAVRKAEAAKKSKASAKKKTTAKKKPAKKKTAKKKAPARKKTARKR